MNCVQLVGNLTRDPELRAAQSGTAILAFSVAVNDRRRNAQTGDWEDVPNYVDCIVFGRRAEGLAKFLAKGAKVAIEGKLRWSQWEKDGAKRSKLEVIVDEIEFMSRGERGQQRQQQTASADLYDENIPF
jgi:single-strand DNA-binding protein